MIGSPHSRIAPPWGRCEVKNLAVRLGAPAALEDGQGLPDELEVGPSGDLAPEAGPDSEEPALEGGGPALTAEGEVPEEGWWEPPPRPKVVEEVDWEIEASKRTWERLPRDAEGDLKWLVWNQIWRKVNAKLAHKSSTQAERDLRMHAAQEDAERLTKHYTAVEQTRTLTRKCLNHIKRQAEIVGDATAVGAREAKWLPAAQAQSLDPPGQLKRPLWRELVVAIRAAGVAIYFICKKDSARAAPHQKEFDDRWLELITAL